MKAVICEKYGPPEVLKLKDIDIPVPKDNELLIKVHASTVTSGVVIIRGGMKDQPAILRFLGKLIFGFKGPKKSILGYEYAGDIEAIGKKVTQFKVGDKVFGYTTSGGYAEYISMPEKKVVVKMPPNMTFEEAAAFPIGATTAYHFLKKKGNIQSGQKVLIYGASGSVGTFAVQLAKYFGAEVTGVCSTSNLDMVNTLGTDKIIDYTKEDFTQSGEYDLVFDAVGKASTSDCKRILSPNGKYVTVAKGLAPTNTEYLLVLKKIIEEGKIKSVIDKTYPLEQIVEAHAYVDKGHKKGNVVIKIS